MAMPRVAIVGRPNVGKSSLLNMLAREKVSIVDSVPGVTRDRVTTIIELPGPLKTEAPKLIELTDTGGYGVYTAEGARFDDAGEDLTRLTDQIETQIAAAVANADLILFVVDAQAGVTAMDEAIGKMLREHRLGPAGKPGSAGESAVRVQVVANKVDSMGWEPHGHEAAALGFGEPWLVSASLNYMRNEFRERLFGAVPYDTGRGDDAGVPEMKVAIVGRRNAGKSTFVNALAGEERCIVSEIAGTTRDAIDVRFTVGDRSCIAIDTAGVRKRTRFADRVEHWAFERCHSAIARADVVLLLIDATQKLAGIDKRLGRAVADAFKPCVIMVTKWDLTKGRKNPKGQPVSAADYEKYIEDAMPGLSHAPIIFTSSVEGKGVREAVALAFELHEQASQRVSTGELNRFFRALLERRGPSSALGTRAKVLYVSQVAVRPPTIVMVVNHPKLFDEHYMRYLMNRIREQLPFQEVPVRVIIRERKRAELNEMRAEGWQAARDAARQGGMVDDAGFEDAMRYLDDDGDDDD